MQITSQTENHVHLQRVPFLCRRIIMNDESVMVYGKFQFAYLIHDTSFRMGTIRALRKDFLCNTQLGFIVCYRVVKTCSASFNVTRKIQRDCFFPFHEMIEMSHFARNCLSLLCETDMEFQITNGRVNEPHVTSLDS